ncbi:UDP-4-amino-4,6-dideoxy-N-acetyl-beta-L-altrosamine N-acetyltransferase [Acetoanaerobium pronyense]|uniref:UDP-4-amino-4, 6-dideoxy-N-acetyl-beta-L-altrosamine N-acetyltransferase n=1 Tax=Acetoanaerobium pronyense TaxID=1482736 RepID=A0ABS4KIS7_9FIRM|nr:UDP-4-amino-4,6-dideoxy-N-acetyl-beta-L-altrosamine N-acetyltransferase [Acetoanaerobium pronyense]MBP2027141.1 UDP-4-amino-4,6-dideoxy-N-acetyl-beta-L-altrosamine N-acetyltransferase [Acetoanaerobium pronyense]
MANLKLRKIKESDLRLIMEWRMKPSITENLYTDPILDIDKQKKWYKKIMNDVSVKYWIIEMESKAIGVIWLYQIDNHNKKCEWGYFIGDDSFRGKGIGRNLECNIYDFVFYKLNMNRLYCEVFNFNDRVIKIHEKFGSEVEGVFKDHIYKKGKFYDVTSMAILKSKWDMTRNDFKYEKIDIEE